jgi:hypothetical protein
MFFESRETNEVFDCPCCPCRCCGCDMCTRVAAHLDPVLQRARRGSGVSSSSEPLLQKHTSMYLATPDGDDVQSVMSDHQGVDSGPSLATVSSICLHMQLRMTRKQATSAARCHRPRRCLHFWTLLSCVVDTLETLCLSHVFTPTLYFFPLSPLIHLTMHQVVWALARGRPQAPPPPQFPGRPTTHAGPS